MLDQLPVISACHRPMSVSSVFVVCDVGLAHPVTNYCSVFVFLVNIYAILTHTLPLVNKISRVGHYSLNFVDQFTKGGDEAVGRNRWMM